MQRLKIQCKMWAVEKNPNAVITLRNRQLREHWTNVDVVSSDMRFWETDERADIMATGGGV